MDLKSVLNDSIAAQPRPPRLHTPQSSYDARYDRTPGSDFSSSRPTPHAPPLQPVDSRALSAGGYFSGHSPHPTNSASASTPSVGTHSAYAQSPGNYPQSFTPRENIPSHLQNANFASPSPSSQQPPTPGSTHHQTHSAPGTYAHNHVYPQYNSPAGPTPNHLTPSQGRQMSPVNQFQVSPATPLGPPINYAKSSPQAQRPQPPVQEHLRRGSYSSVGSAHSRDYSHGGGSMGEAQHRDQIQRSYLAEMRERERSISISPKTIPKPSPYREQSAGSHLVSHSRSTGVPQSEVAQNTNFHPIAERQIESPLSVSMSNTVSISDQKPNSANPSADPSPAPSTLTSHTPRQQHEQLPVQSSSPAPITQSNLKRNASHLSDGPSNAAPPPRKKPRRDEIPIWAQNARSKNLRLGRGTALIPGTGREGRKAPDHRPAPNHTRPNLATNGTTTSGRVSEPPGLEFESTIARIQPFEDMTRQVCEWIHQEIGFADPPPGGAMFEIEAKIGQIKDVETLDRVRLPIASEAIFKSDEYSRMMGRRTKFASSMDQNQHRALNDYLNSLVQQNMQERQQGMPRQEIGYQHPKENDLFFELSQEGKNNLPPYMLGYILDDAHRTHKRPVRVRRTIDTVTNKVKAQIIKTRIADVEIYNPHYAFDYRISISIESPWDGDPKWLLPSSDGGAGRNKDRMSYRHMMFQVDLTQVSYNDKPDLEHELEIEIATEQIRKELGLVRENQPSQYEEMIRGLLDNVRLLCRKGTLER